VTLEYSHVRTRSPLAAMSSLENSTNAEAHSSPLEGEWLRRIAVGRSLASVPDAIASALVAKGFAQKGPDGVFFATEAGKEYLTARGIPTRPRYARRR
jgi:hypothetical protein